MRVRLLANPASGRGRGARRLDEARTALAAAGLNPEIVTTRAAGDETRLGAQAAHDGVDVLVALGGDGTWSQAARGILDADAGERCAIAFLAAGTGNDLVKTLGVPASDYHAIAAAIVAGRERRMDVGRVNGRTFLNSLGFGFDAVVLERMQRPSLLRGDAAYIAAALRELLGYRGLDVAVDGLPETRHLLLVFANGRWFGGAFQIAPDARIDDGLIDLVAVRNASPPARIGIFARAMQGRHLILPQVAHRRAAAFVLAFPEPPVAQVDGELLRLAERVVRVDALPGALRVIG